MNNELKIIWKEVSVAGLIEYSIPAFAHIG